MARYVYFVVAVNIDTGGVIIDDDTFIARFNDGGLYDEDLQEWRDETDEEGELARQALMKAPLIERIEN